MVTWMVNISFRSVLMLITWCKKPAYLQREGVSMTLQRDVGNELLESYISVNLRLQKEVYIASVRFLLCHVETSTPVLVLML